MDAYTTPTPPPATAVRILPETPPPFIEDVTVLTETVTKVISVDNGHIAALIGGIISAVLLLLICVIAVLLWCLSRHKGSYVTNEMDEDDDDIDDNDDESMGSDTALQSREPLKIKEAE